MRIAALIITGTVFASLSVALAATRGDARSREVRVQPHG